MQAQDAPCGRDPSTMEPHTRFDGVQSNAGILHLAANCPLSWARRSWPPAQKCRGRGRAIPSRDLGPSEFGYRSLTLRMHIHHIRCSHPPHNFVSIVRTQINFKLYTLDPKLIQLPIDVSYLHHGFNHVGAFFKFGSLRSAGFSTNSILNQPGAAKEIMRRGHRRKYFLLWLFYLLVYMSISGYCKFCGKSLQSF